MKKGKNKNEIRKKFKKIRDSLPESYCFRAGEKIARKLCNLKVFKEAQTIALYWSKGSEVSTESIFKKIISSGKTALLPRVVGKSIKFHKVIHPSQDLIPGPFGILQPRSNLPSVKQDNIDLILVPGIAFDKKGHRLGYAQGYYDRFLEGLNKFSIGLCYEKTLASQVPNEEHDVPVSCIITEDNLYNISSANE